MNIRKSIAKHLLFPLGDLRAKVQKNLKELEKSQWFSFEQISKIQWDKLNNLLNYSYQNIPYYCELLDTKEIPLSEIKSLEDLSRIPTLSKKIIRGNLDKIISPKVEKKSLIKKSTSGSTGEPVTIFRGRREDSLVSAAGWRSRRWGGHDIGDKYARIWGQAPYSYSGEKKSLKSRIKQTLGDLTEPIEKLNAYETMFESVMEAFYNKIKKKNIQFLIGYANAVYFFARFVNNHHKGELNLQSVRTISEMLDINKRQLIEKVFGCKVFNTYGNRENGIIAAECSYHEGFHINAENLYIEILDEKGNHVPSGEVGEIAVTDLNNYAMPLIRYLTGDLGCLSTKTCSCGRGLPMIEKIEGRVSEMLVLSDGSLVNGHIFGGVFCNFFADDIERYRVIQNVKGEADMYLKTSRALSKEQFEKFKKSINDFTGNRLLIKFHIVDQLPFHESGKYKYIMSNIESDKPV